jgi:deazaflavin-dependent oxidoreductase (nitroreductase family)
MAKRVAAVRISPLLRMGWRLHRWLYRLSGGRIGTRLGPWSALLLVTRGRKSGERRTVGLNYLSDDGRLVVVGSYAGEDRHPAWWLNLLADPRAQVQVGAARYPVTAREVEGPDRDRLWALVVETDPSYATYQHRTTRRIPVVVLERAADGSGGDVAGTLTS